ncbi:MAG: hydroxyethylthiazole kinase [Lactobacillus sp.]|nr:hydroxyethylthiazole kinase [Lactobacillus sp.]
MKLALLDELRAKNPIAYNIANFVTVQDLCNAVNAIGASPAAAGGAEETGEAEDLTKICSSLTVNLGAFVDPRIDNIDTIMGFANQYQKPIILDPVAVGASPARKKRAEALLDRHQVAVIRGNAGEIAALAGADWQAKGIDAGEGSADPVAIAKDLANQRHCVVVESGKTDIITNGSVVVKVYNETDLFKLHVGSGDMLSSIIGCFCGITTDYFEAAQVATGIFSTTGELVAKTVKATQPSAFAASLIDDLSWIDVVTIAKQIRFD